jgi:hypothetical protein
MRTDRLPRQARDKTIRTNSTKSGGFAGVYGFSGGANESEMLAALALQPLSTGGKRLTSAPFYRKYVIVLPRQARDKHRESTQKGRCVFLIGINPRMIMSYKGGIFDNSSCDR